ncbi:hypothetical protein [Dyella sp. 2HG41-7]|uniref:hypothetical protein n=1 Tax=Dyella sp. 2HG41-7 TaxID=2883239 RepID=UPI001F419DFF|nr:hypothetical protein [Dyella sp. 2HG41-7]
MSNAQTTRRSGYLYIASGSIFFLLAIFGQHPSSYGFMGVAVVFVTLGATLLRKAKREDSR